MAIVIRVDLNSVDKQGVLALSNIHLREAIAKLQEPLKDGDAVILTMDELWVRAKVRKTDRGYFEAISDWKFSEGEIPDE